MELKEMIKVMQHFADGGIVECTDTGFDDWAVTNTHYWNWFEYDYRIKEQKKKVTIEKWLCLSANNEYYIKEAESIHLRYANKVKLLRAYEIEL